MDTNKKKNTLLLILVVGIVTMTIAYAALSTTLQINSSATVKGGTWEVRFASGTGANVPTTAPTSGRSAYFNGAPSLTNTTISNVNAVLTQPGDSVTFNFKIQNNGSIDAKLDSITAMTPTCTPTGAAATTTCAHVHRSLKYAGTASKISGGAGSSTMTSGSAVAVNDVLKGGEEISVNLTISYDDSETTETYPDTDVTVSYPSQALLFVQY